MITAKDVEFHTPADADYRWGETNYFCLYIPEEHIVAQVYTVARKAIGVMYADVLILGWIGGSEISPFKTALGQLAGAYYFAHFLIILPLISKFERPLPLPSSISTSVLHGEAEESAPYGLAKTAPAAAH